MTKGLAGPPILVERKGVVFLAACEARGIRLDGCPPYVREWIGRLS